MPCLPLRTFSELSRRRSLDGLFERRQECTGDNACFRRIDSKTLREEHAARDDILGERGEVVERVERRNKDGFLEEGILVNGM